ncbi:hypothetical protein [Micromonospora sp. WMMD1155]|uniref:hypothetical protein n=1 Tax=Micromonospora sp. WMMD1155 TaxID=3016094 RepID=UPI00249A818A|nr:hypothetical protein [Micromonospora sp. WMMD1155]WFE53433.1 hypothetical protein O7617_25300 [Micromonospora sp. WMMD1155]
MGGGGSAADVGASTPLAPGPLGAVASANTNAGGPGSGRAGGPGVDAAAATIAARARPPGRVRPPTVSWKPPRVTVAGGKCDGDGDGDGDDDRVGRAVGEVERDAARALGEAGVGARGGNSGVTSEGSTDVEGSGTVGSGSRTDDGRGTAEGNGRGMSDGSGSGTADGSGRATVRGDSTTCGSNAETMVGDVAASAGRRPLGDG